MTMKQLLTPVALGMVAFTLGGGAAAGEAAVAGAPPATAVPAVFKAPNGIVVSPAMVDLGRMMDVEARQIQFELTNSNTMAVKILRVRAGCSCTKITDAPKEPIIPGGKVVISLEVLGDKLPNGEFLRTAMVEFEGLTPPTVPLKYKGAKIQPITVKPKPSTNLGKILDPAASWSRSFEIVGNLDHGQTLKLGAPVCENSLLKSELQEVSPSHYRLTVTSSGTLPWGSFRGRVRVPVTAPTGYAPILFSFSGQVGERLHVRPALSWFPLVADGQPVTAVRRKVRLSQTTKASQKASKAGAKVAEIKASELKAELPAGVKIVGITQDGPGVTVELEYSPAFLAKEQREKLRFIGPSGQVFLLAIVGGENPVPRFRNTENDLEVNPPTGGEGAAEEAQP